MKNIKIILIMCINTSFLFGQVTSSLRADGTILVNSEPFFPIGYYGEGFSTLAEHTYLADKLNEGGFNITYTEYETLGAQSGQFFDYCATKGVYNLVNFYNMSVSNDQYVTDFVNMHKNKPSLLFWGIADDANNYLAADIERKHNLVENLDSNHLTYQSFYNGGLKLDSVVDKVGVSAMQSYPIFADGNIDRDWDKFNEIVTKCRNNGKASIANLQVYRWPNNTNYRWPTFAELDVQTYLATVAGFKGVIFYTFKDYREIPASSVDITQQPLWDRTKQFAQEVSGTLLNPILNGNRTSENLSDGVYYGKWEYNNEEFVVAINARNNANVITIPVNGTIANNVFGNRNSTLSLNNGNLSGNLAAMDVQIYKVTCSVLPINLTSFNVKKQLNTNQITWQTANETNNNFFELQRSLDGTTFSAINTQKSKGNSTSVQNYFFNDDDKIENTVYYRLKQVDDNGKFSYSKIISLKADFENRFTVYPNPFTSEVNISASKIIVSIKIISASGKIILSKKLSRKNYVLAGADLSNSSYILEVLYEDGSKEMAKLIKQ